MPQITAERISAARIAGGGLLSRRRLLSGSLVIGGAAAAGTLGIIEETQAAPAIPDWAKTAGEPVRAYGLPAKQEAHVKRALIQI